MELGSGSRQHAPRRPVSRSSGFLRLPDRLRQARARAGVGPAPARDEHRARGTGSYDACFATTTEASARDRPALPRIVRSESLESRNADACSWQSPTAACASATKPVSRFVSRAAGPPRGSRLRARISRRARRRSDRPRVGRPRRDRGRGRRNPAEPTRPRYGAVRTRGPSGGGRRRSARHQSRPARERSSPRIRRARCGDAPDR
jgi:hypothetical protein